MRITFHIGAHRTDEDRLLRTLLGNAAQLERHGIAVPRPRRYRKLLGDVMTTLRGTPATETAEEMVLGAILDGQEPEALFLSNENFLCVPDRVLDEGMLYARAFKAAWLRNALPSHEVSFALGLRDPASLIPALFATRGQTDLDFEDWLTGIDPRRLSWAGVVARLREACPDAPLIVWCNEDTPLIWPDLLHAVTGAPADLAFEGELSMAQEIMRPDGAEGLRAFIAANPPGCAEEQHHIVAGFLERFAEPALVEEEIDLPGWNEPLMAELSARYDADLEAIAAMPGVTVITP